MTNGDELRKAILITLAEISNKEKEKAIQYEKYDDALVAGFFEGLFREAAKYMHA